MILHNAGVHAAVAAMFDEMAPDYDENRMHRALAAEVARFIGPLATHAEWDVLDVATGTGLALRALASANPETSLRMRGVDVSPAMLEVARTQLPTAQFTRGGAESLPVRDDSVDLVMCVTGLHVFADAREAIAEWARVLRPNGRATVATFAEGGPQPSPAAGFVVHHDLFRTGPAIDATARALGLTLTRSESWRQMLLMELAHLDARPRERRGLDA